MKKILNLLIVAAATLTLINPSQLQANSFKKIWDPPAVFGNINTSFFPAPSKGFKQFGNLMHFPWPHNYSVFTNLSDGSRMIFTPEEVGWVHEIDAISNADHLTNSTFIYSDSNFGIFRVTGVGFLFVEDADTYPKFKFIFKDDFPHCPDIGWEYHTFSVSGLERVLTKNPDDSIDTIYYATYYGNLEKMDANFEEIKFYNYPKGRRITPKGAELDHHILSSKNQDTLWVVTNGERPSLMMFDIATEEWTVYDEENLPFSWVDSQRPDGWIHDWRDNKIRSHFYDTYNMFLDWDENPKPIVPIKSRYVTEENTYCEDYAFLYFNRETNLFDTIRIDLSEYPGMQLLRPAYLCYNLGKIVFGMDTLLPVPTDDIIPYEFDRKTSFLLYDWETKTFQVLAPDNDLFYPREEFGPPNTWQSLYLNNVGEFVDAEGNLCIAFYYNTLDFISYNPTVSIAEATKNHSIKIVPNPVTESTTLSLELEAAANLRIILYDALGVEIANIYNGYADVGIFSYPINTKHLAKGIYFVKLIIGKESITEKIIVN